MRFGRPPRKDPLEDALAVHLASLEKRMKRVQAEVYAEGVQHGIELTLRSLLGEDHAGDAPGYKGQLPTELRLWATTALAKGMAVDTKAMAANALAKVETSRQRDQPSGHTERTQ